jgi:hypothetical protein
MMNLQEIIDEFNRVREQCYHLARENNGARMGEYAWLRNALDDTDIRMDWTPQGVNCYGYAYTTQTMDNEWFDFTIPFSELD